MSSALVHIVYPQSTIIYVILCLVYYVYSILCIYVCFMEGRKKDYLSIAKRAYLFKYCINN